MFNKLSFQPTNLFVLLAFVLLAMFGSVLAAQASPTYAGAERQKDCAVSVQTGWRPYRVGAGDTLSALAAAANVTLETLIATNCLKSEQISAGDLVLVPTQVVGTANSAMAAPAAANAAQPLLQVISTTTNLATVNVAALEASVTPEIVPMTASPFNAANLIVLAILGLGAMAMVFFALRPRTDDSPVIHSVFGMMGNAIFLFAGVLIGVILFPMVQAPSLMALPTAVSATIAIALIALLVAKELFFSGQQWRTMNRLLNLGIAPLLMLFFLTVASRLAGMMN